MSTITAPTTTSPVIAAFLHTWIDALPTDEREQLTRYFPLVADTNGGPELDDRLAWMITDWVVRVQAPAWMRLAGLTSQAEVMEGLPEVTSASVPSIKARLDAVREDAAAARATAWRASTDWDPARAAAKDAAWDAAQDAYKATAWYAANAAAQAAWPAIRDAATRAAWDTAWDTANAAAWDAALLAAMDVVAAAAKDAYKATASDFTAAKDAAQAALAPMTRDLQASAHELLDRMITVARAENDGD